LVSRGKGRDEKGTPISAPSIHPSIHPSTLVHWWVLVHFGFLLFTSLSLVCFSSFDKGQPIILFNFLKINLKIFKFFFTKTFNFFYIINYYYFLKGKELKGKKKEPKIIVVVTLGFQNAKKIPFGVEKETSIMSHGKP
jgi:hypothetical protein